MIVEPDFLGHWKTKMLITLLSDPCAPLYLIAIWAHCQQRKTDRFPAVMAPAMFKAVSGFTGDQDTLFSALKDCGYLDFDGSDVVLHGWAETNAKLVSNWKNGPKGGRPKEPKQSPPETQAEPTGNPTITQQEPTGNPNSKSDNPPETDREDRVEKIDKNGIDGVEGAPAADPNLPSHPDAPTLDACIRFGASNAVDEVCATKFWHENNSVGWRDKFGRPFAKGWRNKLHSYKLTWDENRRSDAAYKSEQRGSSYNVSKQLPPMVAAPLLDLREMARQTRQRELDAQGHEPERRD